MDVSVTIHTQLPAGSSVVYRGGAVEYGYLLEDGSLVSRVTYARLFEKIGTTYGAGDGSTTFRLPGASGRVDIGSGTGSGLTNRTLGQTGGAETHQLTEAEMPSHTHSQNAHSHGITDPGHEHSIPTNSNNASGTQVASANGAGTNNTSSTSPKLTGVSVNSATAVNQNTGGNVAHNIMQPYLVATKMIKY